jgi:hypothetical protein
LAGRAKEQARQPPRLARTQERFQQLDVLKAQPGGALWHVHLAQLASLDRSMKAPGGNGD